MIRYLIVSVASGILFGALDGIAHGNTAAQRLYEVYKPISKASANVPAGIIIDLVYGFAMAAIFLTISKSLPGESGLVKGLLFGLLVWFFRTVMYVVSQWMMFTVPAATLAYLLAVGRGEMLILGVLYGITLTSR